jgi:hypothetical protein
MKAKQRRQKLSFDNLDELLSSSPTARRKGAQQFETPGEVAEALCLPLPPRREVIADLHCGHGALLRAAALSAPLHDTRSLLGLDIDPTASIPDIPAKFHVQRKVIVGDFTKIAPLLLAARTRFDLLVLNPPFSLQWRMEVSGSGFQVSGSATVPQPGGTPRQPETRNQKPSRTIDSTLATFEIAHRLLTKRGEGMMICSAVTCARLLETHPLWRKTWLKLTVPNFFPGVLQKMKIAVVYFAAGHHGSAPLEVTAPDAMPDTIRRVLQFAADNRDKLIAGETVKRAHDCWPGTGSAFEAVADEWKRQTDAEYAARNGWNIRLTAKGMLSAYVTPFQTIAGDVPKELVSALKAIDGQHPAGLVVQRTSRKALVLATQGGVWRVHPDVTAAVDAAMKNYNAVRAPQRPLNAVQRLGHLDEEDDIRCEVAPGVGFTAGRSYALESETFQGRKVERRPHPGGEKDCKEEVLVTGQELLLRIRDDAGEWHAFTQYDLGRDQQAERPEKHFHLLAELVECFHIPDVPDIAQVHPDEFAEYQRRLRALEWV